MENPDIYEQLRQQPNRADVSIVDWIKVATERIVDQFQPEQVILFGSQARGDATRHSDVDFLVVFEEIKDKRERAVAIRVALSDLPIAKDVVVTTHKEIDEYGWMIGRVLRPALKDGKVLYDQR